MLYAASRDEMRKMDEATIHMLGLPEAVLMENAGAKVAEDILAAEGAAVRTLRVAVLAGGGNNGGDGFVIARRLIDAGADVRLGLLVPRERVKGTAKLHMDVYLNRNLPIFHVWELPYGRLREELARADVIVDAMLGTGAGGPLREPYGRAIALVNEWSGVKPIVAVDIPSGLDSDDGSVADQAVTASRTITFVFPKRGFFLREGPAHVGEWKAADISVPRSLADTLGLSAAMPRLIDAALAASWLPRRPAHGHKGTFGHALIVGGSRRYVGAPVFAAKAAIHAGAGLVTAAVPENIYPSVAPQMPEAIFRPLPEREGRFDESAAGLLAEELGAYACAAVGPGMGRFPGGEKFLLELLAAMPGRPIVFDADALVLLRGHWDAVRRHAGPVLLTPHPGEMAAMLGETVTAQDVERDRIGTARAFSEKWGVHLLLKGHRTVIAAPGGAVWINPIGSDALGKGGSGDVLTGLIAALLAQGASPEAALGAAAWLHACAGERKAEELSRFGVTPLDLIDGVKRILLDIGSQRV